MRTFSADLAPQGGPDVTGPRYRRALSRLSARSRLLLRPLPRASVVGDEGNASAVVSELETATQSLYKAACHVKQRCRLLLQRLFFKLILDFWTF